MDSIESYSAENLVQDLLDANLGVTLTREKLLSVCDNTFFRYLPLILGAIEAIGAHDLPNRPLFVALVDALRIRVNRCRAIKLRFLLLVRDDAIAHKWHVTRIHRRDCYAVGRLEHETALDTLADAQVVTSNDLRTHQSSQSAAVAAAAGTPPPTPQVTTSDELLADDGKLLKFAVTKVFPPAAKQGEPHVQGITMRTHRHRLRTFPHTFIERDLVDFLTEHLNCANRDAAVAIGERFRQEGIIQRMGSRRSKAFADGKHPYQSMVSVGRMDRDHAAVITSEGKKIACFNTNEGSGFLSQKITRVDLRIPMDVMDLQSFDFWSRDVFTKGIAEGTELGVRAVTHPLIVVASADTHSYVDVSQMSSMASSLGSTDMIDRHDSEVSMELADLELDEIPTHTSSSSMSQMATGNNPEGVLVVSAVVRKVFSSIARPSIVALRYPRQGALLSDDSMYIDVPPAVLVKTGDNLVQDQSAEIMFRIFNHIWTNDAPTVFPDAKKAPYAFTYEVIPTGKNAGFMEAVTGLKSLKDYDWDKWVREHGKDKECIDNMCRSSAGSYVAAYVLGVRDRHWDNILIKDNRTMMHIDFGYMLGSVPPIDGPRFSISPAMEAAFAKVGCWDLFVEKCVKSFKALRDRSGPITRAAVMLFQHTGLSDEAIRDFMRSRNSLAVHHRDDEAEAAIRRQLSSSSRDWKNKLKSYSHQNVDPVFYGMLQRGFPPAVLAMRIVEAKENTKALKRASAITEAAADEALDLDEARKSYSGTFSGSID